MTMFFLIKGKSYFTENTIEVEIFVALKFGVLSNNCIWRYINLMKFKVLLYNLKCCLHDWYFNSVSSEKIAKSPNFNPSQNFYSYGITLLTIT